MPELSSSETMIERIQNLAIVSLKVSSAAADEATERLSLAAPLRANGSEPQSLWMGPDQWLFVSRSQSASSLIDSCSKNLSGLLFSAVDLSAGLVPFRIAGSSSRQLLASGSGLDVRVRKLKLGDCCRTRLAQLPAVIVSSGDDQFDLYVYRSYERYLCDWLMDTARNARASTTD